MPLLILMLRTTAPDVRADGDGSQAAVTRHDVGFGYQVLFNGGGRAYVWRDLAGILMLGTAPP